MKDKNRKAMFAKNQKPHVYEHYHKVNNKMIDDKSDSDAKKKYQQAMKKLANKNGKIDLNNGNVYDEFGKIRDNYNSHKWNKQGLSDDEIYQKWEESQ